MTDYIDIVFDGPTSRWRAGRFVEVEDAGGASISIGEWVPDGDLWRLRIPDPRDLATLRQRHEELESEAADLRMSGTRLNNACIELRQRLAEAVEKAWREAWANGYANGLDPNRRNVTADAAWLASEAKARLT